MISQHHAELLKRYAIEPKKSLGQNFLVNDVILENISEFIDIENRHVIEVGPGYGALTERLIAANPASLTLVEYDPRMVSILQDRQSKHEFDFAGTLNIIEQDVLQFDPKKSSLLIANIPYYITSPILFRFLYEVTFVPTEMLILMQKEVADKITKQKGYQNSYLSLALEHGCDILEKQFEVEAANFVPAPKVDSAVVYFRTKSVQTSPEKTKSFLKLISQAFSQPRKKVVSNLANGGVGEKEDLEALLLEFDIRADARAETINLSDWYRIFDRLCR